MNHLYDNGKVIHQCEDAIVHGIRLVWTKCERDVPANQSFMSDESVTCERCMEVVYE